MKRCKIGFVGVGKLGQACAEMIAEKHTVVGYDINLVEPDNFTMVSRIKDAVIGQDIIFVAVPTPHSEEYDGSTPTSQLAPQDFDYSIVESVLKEINTVAESHQLVVLISTVLPGTTRRQFAPLITNAHFLYNPFLIAMGTVKWDMVNPEMIMIGTEDGSETGTALQLKEFYQTIIQNDPPYIVGTWEEMESLKCYYNTFISAKIGLVNMIQDTAEKIGHMNAEIVCDALAACNRRIMGPSYMKPGMGDSGHCHPRDNIALRWFSKTHKLGYDLFGAVMDSREAQARNMAELLEKSARQIATTNIVIVGKAYKPLVEYTGGSASILVGSQVYGHAVHYWDDLTNDTPADEVLNSPAVYLLAHSPEVTYGAQLDFVKQWYEKSHRHLAHADTAMTRVGNVENFKFAPGSVIVDPWRRFPIDTPNCTVIHYGNTRNR
jgi:UDPglucose 6-dehydrogenase